VFSVIGRQNKQTKTPYISKLVLSIGKQNKQTKSNTYQNDCYLL
jgi:hypothetical protein